TPIKTRGRPAGAGGEGREKGGPVLPEGGEGGDVDRRAADGAAARRADAAHDGTTSRTRAQELISGSQTPVWERLSSETPVSSEPGETEFRERAFPNRSLGTRNCHNSGYHLLPMAYSASNPRR